MLCANAKMDANIGRSCVEPALPAQMESTCEQSQLHEHRENGQYGQGGLRGVVVFGGKPDHASDTDKQTNGDFARRMNVQEKPACGNGDRQTDRSGEDDYGKHRSLVSRSH